MKLKVLSREFPGGSGGLRLRAVTAVGPGSVPGEGTKNLKVVKVQLKINKLKKKYNLRNTAPTSCNQEVSDRRKKSRRK